MKLPKLSVVIAGVAAVTLIGLWPILAYAGDSVSGTVTAVKSGDLISLDYGQGTYEVRIGGIVVDSIRPIGREATQYTTTQLLGKFVRLRVDGRNAQGEMIGRIWLTDATRRTRIKDVGLEMVRFGLARVQEGYPAYRYGEMVRAEAEARRLRRGMWKQ